MRTKKEINMEVGARVKAARESREVTQERLAELVDVSPQYVSDMERGVVGLSLTTLKRVCTVLGVSSDTLLFGQVPEGRLTRLEELCRSLSEEQFQLLTGIAVLLQNQDKS